MTRLHAEILSLKTFAQRLDACMVWNNAELPPKGEWLNLANQIGVSPEALYREIANIVIDVTLLTPDEIADAILRGCERTGHNG